MPIVVGEFGSVTALDILKRSLRMIGVYAIGEEPSAEETADGMFALNSLMGSISNTGLVYSKTLDTISVAGGTQSIEVGPSGDTITDRPIRVLSDSYFVLGEVSYPLDVITLQQYNDISLKGTTGIPTAIRAQMDMPNVTLTFWPIPSDAITLNLWSLKALSGTLTAATVLSFPPGYYDALAYLLAEAIAPEYSVGLSQSVADGVRRSRKLLKRASFEVPQLDIPCRGAVGTRDITTL